MCQKNNFRNKMSQTAIYVSMIAICVVMTGCLSSREFISTEEKFSRSQKATSFHIVENGDTLFSIAWTYGWDYHELALTNSITKPYTIYVGQKIDIVNPPLVKTSAIVSSAGKTSKWRAKKEKPAKSTAKVLHNKPIKPSLGTQKGWKWPAKGKVIGRFLANDSQNKGIDIAGKLGESVSAAAAGTVVYAGKGLRGYGNLVIIKHDAKFLSAYAHTSRILVREKEKITAGQIIAEIGSTGTNRVKLHFEIRRNGRPVDPLQFLPKWHTGGG
ncbi:MAG: lipoprotein NlpD [Oleispira sp.]|jgi:lipoprotein NlpD